MSDTGFDLGLDDPAGSGVYAVGDGDLPTLAAAARDAGLRVASIDLDNCGDKRTLLMRIATQLDFPNGHGRNWDALSDGLSDLSWLPATGYALLFGEAGHLRTVAEEDFDTLLDILQEVAARWADEGIPFRAFIELPSPLGNGDNETH